MGKSIDILALLSGEPSEKGEDDSAELRAKAVFKAIKADDFPAFSKALRAYVTKCKSDGPPSDTSDND